MSSAASAGPSGHVRTVVADGVVRLTIDHESRLNALTGDSMRAIVAGLERAGTDESVRVVVLTGAGRAFCSGADLTDIGGDDADPAAIMAGAEMLVRAVLETPVPVVARVNGPAVGIGMSLALAADLAYAGPDAYLLQSFLGIGLMPDGGSTLLLTAAMGRARANEAVLLGRRIPAAEAAAHGLVAGAAGTTDELDGLVERAVAKVVAAPGARSPSPRRRWSLRPSLRSVTPWPARVRDSVSCCARPTSPSAPGPSWLARPPLPDPDPRPTQRGRRCPSLPRMSPPRR